MHEKAAINNRAIKIPKHILQANQRRFSGGLDSGGENSTEERGAGQGAAASSEVMVVKNGAEGVWGLG